MSSSSSLNILRATQAQNADKHSIILLYQSIILSKLPCHNVQSSVAVIRRVSAYEERSGINRLALVFKAINTLSVQKRRKKVIEICLAVKCRSYSIKLACQGEMKHNLKG